MKRIMYLSISVLCLVVTLIVNTEIAEAQLPPDIIDYCVFEYETAPTTFDMYHFVMAANGDIYVRWHTTVQNGFGNPIYLIGNFWECVPQPSSEVLYYWAEIGDNVQQGVFVYHYVMVANGDVYVRRNRPQETTFDWDCCYLMGNFWEGLVSTDQSPWGEIKDKFKE